SLEEELKSLIRAGYKIVGPRWTALREEDGRVALLRIPGSIQRDDALPSIATSGPGWTDITARQPWAECRHAFASAVVAIAPARGAKVIGRQVEAEHATALIRHAWPMPDVTACATPSRRRG